MASFSHHLGFHLSLPTVTWMYVPIPRQALPHGTMVPYPLDYLMTAPVIIPSSPGSSVVSLNILFSKKHGVLPPVFL